MNDAALSALQFTEPPLTQVQLDERVRTIAGALDIPFERARVLITSVIVAQMLPEDTVVKGGIGVKLRLGEVGTRATRDVDVVARDRTTFLQGLNQQLSTGWGWVPPSKGAVRKNPDAPPRVAFTGTARPARRAQPGNVPTEYLMEPYFVTLSFMGSPWVKVPVEVGHDEIDGLDLADHPSAIAEQVAMIGQVLGFGELEPVALISLEQQIAQKIHAATEPGSQRAHDLIDLQLLWNVTADDGRQLDLTVLAELCRRTFTYRAVHAWPPAVTMPDLLEPAYQVARQDADPRPPSGAGEESTVGVVVPTLARACAWLNARVEEIDAR